MAGNFLDVGQGSWSHTAGCLISAITVVLLFTQIMCSLKQFLKLFVISPLLPLIKVWILKTHKLLMF